MPRKSTKKPRKPLEGRDAAIVAGVKAGLSRNKSAVLAGFPDRVSLKDLPVGVQAALGDVVKENIKFAGGITREEVIQGLLDAANMGRIEADPMSMIAAYRELGKMCGYYAPEVKKIEHELGKETIHALENLSDAELLRISRGRVIGIEDKSQISEATIVSEQKRLTSG